MRRRLAVLARRVTAMSVGRALKAVRSGLERPFNDTREQPPTPRRGSLAPGTALSLLLLGERLALNPEAAKSFRGAQHRVILLREQHGGTSIARPYTREFHCDNGPREADRRLGHNPSLPS